MAMIGRDTPFALGRYKHSMSKSFSDSWRNPCFVEDGPAFNHENHSAPAPVSQATKNAACERNKQVIQDAKSNLGRTDSQPRMNIQHDAWVNYVREKLLELNDC